MLTKTKLPRNVGLAAILAAQKDPGNSALQEFKEKTGLYIEDDWKRVKLIFQQGLVIFFLCRELFCSLNQFEKLICCCSADGLYHPDLYEVLDATKSGALAAGSFGAIYTYLNSIEQYRSTADSNVYQHKSDANRALARHGFQGMAYGALRYAPYGALFLGGFTSVLLFNFFKLIIPIGITSIFHILVMLYIFPGCLKFAFRPTEISMVS